MCLVEVSIDEKIGVECRSVIVFFVGKTGVGLGLYLDRVNWFE